MAKQIYLYARCCSGSGHYSQGIRYDNIIHATGQGAPDETADLVVRGGAVSQTEPVYQNEKAILGAA